MLAVYHDDLSITGHFLHESPCLRAGLLKVGMKAGTRPSMPMLYDVQF